MIISFHKGFILTRSLLKALRDYLSKRKCIEEIFYQERKPDNTHLPTLAKEVRAAEAEFEADVGLRFFPPVYVQRYLVVQDILSDGKWGENIKKVIDFGCAEFGFFSYAKHITGVEEILTVDIDEKLLQNHRCRIAPLTSDYLSRRSGPLKVQAFVGSIAKLDQCLLGTDAVVCIEIIEHLWPEEVESVPYTVFGFIKPKVAIFTTPNSDFNVLFPNFSGFRHFDHKFEWSREQFQCWAANITLRYPEYDVSIDGIGPGPPGTERYGHCSQMAVFIKRTPISGNFSENISKSLTETFAEAEGFKLLFEYDYPFREDKRTDKEKICQEAEYYIRMFATVDLYCNDEGTVEIPLSLLMPHVEQWCDSHATLISILGDNGWEMSGANSENPAVIYPGYGRKSDFSSSEDENEADETSVTVLADNASDSRPYEYEDWGLEDAVPPPLTCLPNGSDIMSLDSQDICVCSVDSASSLLGKNDSHIIESFLPIPNSFYGSNSINLPVAEEMIQEKVDPAQEYLLSDSHVFHTKDRLSSNHGTAVQTLPSDESAGFTLNGQALNWKQVANDAAHDSDDHETPSVSGEWGMSSPELVSCASMASQEGTTSFRSAISHDASDPESDQEMDLSIEHEVADSDDSDGSQGPPIDNPRRVQQHRGHFPFGLNAVVENGDVANNNQDGEGNNAIALGGVEEDGNFQLFEEDAGDHEVADGIEDEDDLEEDEELFEVLLPNNADPFPEWLLQMLDILNQGEEMGGAGEPQWFVNE